MVPIAKEYNEKIIIEIKKLIDKKFLSILNYKNNHFDINKMLTITINNKYIKIENINLPLKKDITNIEIYNFSELIIDTKSLSLEQQHNRTIFKRDILPNLNKNELNNFIIECNIIGFDKAYTKLYL